MPLHVGTAPRATDRDLGVIPATAGAAGDPVVCAEMARTHARTFSLASYLLPATKRRAAYALYAFCRVADDLVDRADTADTRELSEQLADYERQLTAALAGRPSGPVFREIAWVAHEYEVPAAPLYELLHGVARDLRPARYATWSTLELYCEGVASSVGEMCTHVFGVPGGAEARQRAVRYARTLGVAMQLTNILRDIGEDAQRGRCYLPEDDLARFGLSVDEVLTNPALPRDERWKPFMAFEVGRARVLYEAAMPGIALLAHDAHRCTRACAVGYAGILNVIEQQGYDTYSRRARLSRMERLKVLWDAWRFRAAPLDTATVGDGPIVRWDAEAADRGADWVRLA
jgi:phytoene synthase